MSRNLLSMKTNLPDQKILVAATLPSQWPLLTLALIKDQSISITNNSLQPILLDDKHTQTNSLTPASVIDSSAPTQYGPYQSQNTANPSMSL